VYPAETSKILGAFQSYGRVSDHYREILAAYGNVIPGGTGPPGFGGWPLGLDIDFRVFNFTLPAVASAYYMELLVINRSEDIYGVGVDYDSLYFGIQNGTGGAPQAHSDYWQAYRNTAIFHQSGVNPSICADATRRPTGVSGCAGAGLGATSGYRSAGNALVWLKSPYGDSRNKLFTRSASAFYDPTHPLAGDTILFNHGHMCGFGGCWANTHNVNDRRAFGMLSSTEANILDGRAIPVAGTEAWRTYRNREYPTVRGVFNKWVPGGFDYNDDGTQDTLYFDTCGGPITNPAAMALGCVTLDGDTMPGGQINAYGNVGGITAVGPFPLAAGDTAVFVWAFVGDRNPPSAYATVDAVINHYNNFYLAPEPPPVVDISTVQLNPPSDGLPSATLFFSDTAENFVDAFILKRAQALASAPPGTVDYRIAQLNPNLVNQLTDRATSPARPTGSKTSGNLDTLFIFKSCDGGATFTGDGDCEGDPTVDAAGNAVGFGFEAYAIVPDTGQDLPNTFTDFAVQGGRTYLYLIVGKSRGASFTIRDSIDTNGDQAFDAIGFSTFTVADPLSNPLSRSATDPNVVSVYVPTSRQAGSSPSSSAFISFGDSASVPLSVSLTDAAVAGSYAAIFGNRLTIMEFRTGTDLDSTRVFTEDTVVDTTGATVAIASDVAFRVGASAVPYAGTPTVTVSGDTTTYVFTALGFALYRGTEPLFVSTTLTGSEATPPTLFGRDEFPGFVVSADNSDAGTYSDEATIDASGNTVSQGNVENFMVQWLQAKATTGANFNGGRYVVRWLSDPLGLTRGLVLNLGDPSATQAELQAALSSRPTGTLALADAATATLTGIAQTGLVAARLPFTITNTLTGKAVQVAMRARTSNTALLGTGFDTIRVEVQATEWIPGDTLLLIDSVVVDSTIGGEVVLGPGGQPIPAPTRRVSFTRAIIGCALPRDSCNPVRELSPGQSGYVPMVNGFESRFHYFRGFTRDSRYDFTVAGPVTGADITQVTRAQLDSIRVVPNPFVVFSTYQSEDEGGIAESRVLFTHLPPRGTIRVYSVSGQFLQQITYDEADLNGAGDLFYNLRTREGTDLASGLYIWVLTTNVGGTTQRARGKFVVIRGQNQ
jgi:hypothetical protein